MVRYFFKYLTFIYFSNMDKDFLLLSYSKYFPESSLGVVKDKIDSLDDSKISMMYMQNYKDPTTSIILSVLVGSLGIDRFFIGDTILGVIKLLTCGGFGIWTIIDWFLIMETTKQKNFNKFMYSLGY